MWSLCALQTSTMCMGSNAMHILGELAVNGRKERACVRRHRSMQMLESGILHFMNKNYCIQRIRQYTPCCGWKKRSLRSIECYTSLFNFDFRENIGARDKLHCACFPSFGVCTCVSLIPVRINISLKRFLEQTRSAMHAPHTIFRMTRN